MNKLQKQNYEKQQYFKKYKKLKERSQQALWNIEIGSKKMKTRKEDG